MQLHTSYDAAFQAALATQTFAIARLQHIKLPMNIDTSGCYKLFYFNSGAKKFHIDHSIYDIEPGDLFFVNQREWHYFSQISEEDSHERIFEESVHRADRPLLLLYAQGKYGRTPTANAAKRL